MRYAQVRYDADGAEDELLLGCNFVHFGTAPPAAGQGPDVVPVDLPSEMSTMTHHNTKPSAGKQQVGALAPCNYITICQICMGIVWAV